jgi:hypothetical protein
MVGLLKPDSKKKPVVNAFSDAELQPKTALSITAVAQLWKGLGTPNCAQSA